ncbi:MAG: PilN domain-containing protein [Clostridia bacterium]|nr:PilN domain-containing protein [Clostridia bacterium]
MKDLNLIPKSYLQARKNKIRKMYYTLAVAGGGIILILALALPLQQRFKLQYERDKIDRSVRETSKYITIESQLNAIKELYKQREDEAGRLMKYGVDVAAILEKVERSLPEKLFIKSMDIGAEEGSEDIQVKLECISESEDEISTFVTYLRSEKYFENIVVYSVKRNVLSTVNASANPSEDFEGTYGEVQSNGQIQYSSSIALFLKTGK